MIKIESRANDKFKFWLELTKSKGLKKEGFLILPGKKLCLEILSSKKFEVVTELIPSGHTAITSDIKKHFELSHELFNELDVLGTKENLFILRNPIIQKFEQVDRIDGLEIICPISDPSNLGAIIRSAVAFGVNKIILTKESANPFLQKSLKASSGYAISAPLFQSDLSIHDLLHQSENCYALDMHGEEIGKVHFQKNCRLILGQEGQGIPQATQIKKIRIPTEQVESLNVAIAASIVLFQIHSSKK